jgi:hypothetical protein
LKTEKCKFKNRPAFQFNLHFSIYNSQFSMASGLSLRGVKGEDGEAFEAQALWHMARRERGRPRSLGDACAVLMTSGTDQRRSGRQSFATRPGRIS